MTVLDHLRTRLRAALDRVVGGDGELTAIALDAGFASHSHFTARFRALFGVTPAEQRRSARTAPSAAPRKNVKP
jgi:AraC family transcriptional regulator